MDREEIRVAVLRMEGTNCEDETVKAFQSLGVEAEAVHVKQFYSDMIRFEEQRSVLTISVSFSLAVFLLETT